MVKVIREVVENFWILDQFQILVVIQVSDIQLVEALEFQILVEIPAVVVIEASELMEILASVTQNLVENQNQ